MTHAMPQVKKVLLVDDDPGLLFPLSKDLSADQSAYRLVVAGNGKEALEILAREDIALVVSDVNMPGITGFDLLATVRERYPQIGVILMTAYGTEKMRQIVRESGCLYFLEKPFRFDMLRGLIEEQLAKKPVGFNGTLKNILLTDLIQICCIAGADMAIRVTDGSSEGVFYIESGEVIHAECCGETGENALYRIIKWESGSFESIHAEQFPATTINKPYMYLLMEGSRLSDESAGRITEEDSPEDDDPEGRAELPDDFLAHAVAWEADPKSPLRILIVDDSAVMCRILTDIMTADGKIEVAGSARNGQEALRKIDELKPDLITLDINMPVMGGGTALKHIMIKNRCPVVVVSSLNSGSYQNVLDFLLLGAVDFIGKPSNNDDLSRRKQSIIRKILNAGMARTDHFIRYKSPGIVAPERKINSTLPGRRFVLICSGAGGYAELVQLVARIPGGIGANIVIMHDMTRELSPALGRYLDQRSFLNVTPLAGSVPLLREHCYLGATEIPFRLEKTEGAFMMVPLESGAENQDPGIQIRLADEDCADLMVVLLSGAMTGESADLNRVKRMDGRIVVKSPGSCMVPDTLEAVLRAGTATEECDLPEIAGRIADFCIQAANRC